jgi:hypothetical protein
MSSNTPNLDLYMKNPLTDGNDTFNIETMLNENWRKIDQKAATKEEVAAHQADYVKHPGEATTTNSSNAYGVTLNPAPTSYVKGMGVVITINANSTAATTLNVNGLGAKKILKANGNAVINLKANGIYTVRYNPAADSGNGAFILQGEGGEYGTADAPQVLQGYTVGKETGIVSGSMPNIGNNWQIAKTVQGYHDGSTGRILLKPPLGYYNEDTECRVYADDPDFHPNNFLSTVNVFGLQGTIPIPPSQGVPWRNTNGDTFVDMTPPQGYWDGVRFIEINDPDLHPQNISAQANIFGVQGGIPVRGSTGGNGASGAPHHWAPFSVDDTSSRDIIYTKPCSGSGGDWGIHYKGDVWLATLTSRRRSATGTYAGVVPNGLTISGLSFIPKIIITGCSLNGNTGVYQMISGIFRNANGYAQWQAVSNGQTGIRVTDEPTSNSFRLWNTGGYSFENLWWLAFEDMTY